MHHATLANSKEVEWVGLELPLTPLGSALFRTLPKTNYYFNYGYL